MEPMPGMSLRSAPERALLYILKVDLLSTGESNMADYAHPETLVSTDWVAQHAADPKVRVVEVDVDTKAYDEGHAPGALGWAWNSQLCDTLRRDILPKTQFEELMASSGISNDTTVVIYGEQQLVRGLGAVADENLWPQGRASDERRAQKVVIGRARAFHRSS